MKGYQRSFEVLEAKIDKLVSGNEELKSINKTLEEENITLLNTIKDQQNLIKELENKINVIKIKNSLELDKDPINAKSKVNEMLREIDRCIALLDQ